MDMELVRQILLSAEGNEDGYISPKSLGKYNRKEVTQHIELMKKDGLIESPLTIGIDESSKVVACRGSRLTQKGRDCLDEIRNA